jgi:amidohydrolase
MSFNLQPHELETLKELRMELHSVAELSGKEYVTSERIISFLKECRPDNLITGVGGYGVIATWNSELQGHEILIRADMDALPVQELNGFHYRSQNDHVSHKCGHDGHMAIVCGLALLLSKQKPEKGKVHLLFQPSEENGRGAMMMLNDKKFARIQPDVVFALHNIPGFPLHSVIVKDHSFSSAVNSIMINLHGKTSHASEPEHGLNPGLAVAEVLSRSVQLEKNEPESENMQLITPVYALLGEKAYGTSAGHATLHFTLRCRDNKRLEHLQYQIEALATEIAGKHGLMVDFEYTETFYANENDPRCVDMVKQAALKAGLKIIHKDHPFKWGEDFGMFTKKYRGCMFGLGAGENCPALHSPDYDFPDEIIVSGINIFYNIMKEVMNV